MICRLLHTAYFGAALLAALVTTADTAVAQTPFPRPPEIESDVRFWTRVFTEVDTHSGLIHDNRHLGVVYEVLRFPSRLGPKARKRRVLGAKRRYKKSLLRLASGRRDSLSPEDQRVLALWPKGVTGKSLRKAAGRLRFQGGQSNRIRAGIVRAGRWERQIRNIFSEMGVPEELVALPLVESAYHPGAYSRVGAAGLWQFIPSTGRRYLHIDSVVDERMDPVKASKAAARLLKHNYQTLGTWPLAVIAYNHGAAGMKRAARKLGTRDVATIMREYNGRTFRFASRNFYPEFLAAVDVYNQAERYFGALERETPQDNRIVTVPAYMTVDTIRKALGVDRDILRIANPALRSGVWKQSKYVPRGYPLRVPQGSRAGNPVQALAAVPASARFRTQRRSASHKVRRGETLSQIAARFKTSVKTLVKLNSLRSANHIRAGQKLRLPGTT